MYIGYWHDFVSTEKKRLAQNHFLVFVNCVSPAHAHLLSDRLSSGYCGNVIAMRWIWVLFLQDLHRCSNFPLLLGWEAWFQIMTRKSWLNCNKCWAFPSPESFLSNGKWAGRAGNSHEVVIRTPLAWRNDEERRWMASQRTSEFGRTSQSAFLIG